MHCIQVAADGQGVGERGCQLARFWWIDVQPQYPDQTAANTRHTTSTNSINIKQLNQWYENSCVLV